RVLYDHNLAAAQFKSSFESGGLAAIGLVDDLNAVITRRQCIQDFTGAVCRSIIDYNQLKTERNLVQDTPNNATHSIPLVERRHDNGESGIHEDVMLAQRHAELNKRRIR